MRVKTEAKRDAIVQAASDVFLESGFEGASMAEIAVRVGGSKATLYGYFESKELLFIEVMHKAAKKEFAPIFGELESDVDDLHKSLQRFGERALGFLCSEQSIKGRRAIISEAGRSDIGRRFFETGPQRGIKEVARFLDTQMARGRLRNADAQLAASQLFALFECETIGPSLYGVTENLSKVFIKRAVRNALAVFFAAYAVGEGHAHEQPSM